MTPETEVGLDQEFRDLASHRLIAPMGGYGSRSMTGPDGIEAAASTCHGGLDLSPQSTENYLLAAEGRTARIIGAVCQGNEKHTSTMVAGTLVLSELHKQICGQHDAADLHGDLERAMVFANHRIRNAANDIKELANWTFGSCFGRSVTDLKGIGTSVAAAAIQGSHLVVGHVGECSVFLFRAEKLERLTADHTLRAQPEHQAHLRSHPDRPDVAGDIPTRVLGFSRQAKVDLLTCELRPEDVLVLGNSLLPRMKVKELLRAHRALGSAELCRIFTEAARLQDRPDLAATHVVIKLPDL